MKKLTILLGLTVLVLFSCNDKATKNKRLVPASSGNINNLLVVVDNLLWEDKVGETIRNLLADQVVGLPQEEPLFNINQMPTQVFSGFTTKNRIILKIEKGKEAGTKIGRDVYAKPQTLIVVSGKTDAEIINELTTSAAKIIDTFKQEEITEKQRRIKLSLFDDKPLRESLGVSLKLPSVYRLAKATDNTDGFFWIRKDLTTGLMDIMVYQVPLNTLKKGDSLVSSIVKMRDSIGKKHIEGRLEGSYMITEKAYAPYVFETVIDHKPTIETKGIWEVKNDFMSGPFVNYAIEDKANNRYVVLEGYVFAPSINKRDYMFELEAIIKSAKLK